MKMKLSLFLMILLCFKAHASLDFWKVTDARELQDDRFVLEEEYVWKVLPNQVEHIHKMDKEDLKKKKFGGQPIEHIHEGDRMIIKKEERGTIIFQDLETDYLICCELESYPSNLPKISKIDENGYHITLSDGTEWTISWLGSFSSNHWNLGDVVVPMRCFKDSSIISYNFFLLNIESLAKKSRYTSASALRTVWKK